MRLRRKQPGPLDQLRTELNREMNRADWRATERKMAADHALARALAALRGDDLRRIRELLDNQRMDEATVMSKIRDILDQTW